jgi:5-methylcytosine-specific restriction enzyme subunit McrC
MLWVAEHGRIFKGAANRLMPNGDLELSVADFESLLTLLEDDDDSQDLEPVFKYAQPRGRPQLKVQNYVGLIRTGTGLQIEVLPKLARAIDPAQARELLIRMLIELEDSPFREANEADLRAHNMPLFEILIRYFLRRVTDIVRKGIARTYVEEQGSLRFLRGKLVMGEHIRRNAVNASNFYCEYDEYQANRPINRLIRAGLDVAAKLSKEPKNEQRCRELLYWFDEVPASTDFPNDFHRIQRDRLIQHYLPAMPVCRLLLESLNPLTQQGSNRAISMLFPMERVFEDFVAAKLRKQLEGWKIKTQARGRSLIENHRERKMFALVPDMVLSNETRKIVADTKWKLIDQAARDNKYKISQPDIYQLFAYSKKFLGGQDVKEVILIYPASEKFDSPLEPFWYEDLNEVLHVVPFDLATETLLLHEESALCL